MTEPQATEPSLRIETFEFTAEHLDLLAEFECGSKWWEQLQVEWIRKPPPFDGALLAKQKWGTTVWLHQICVPMQEEPFIIGYSSLGHTNLPDPFPDGQRRRIQYIPGLALAEQFQGQSYDGKKYSHIIMEHILSVATDREPGLVGLHVYPENEKAIRLYRRFGFKVIGGPDKKNLLAMWCKLPPPGDAILAPGTPPSVPREPSSSPHASRRPPCPK